MSSSAEESYSCLEMAKPLTAEAIAINEKKMSMTLDDIIKMSKNTGNKAKKQRSFPNKMQKFPINATQDRLRKLKDSRSSLRQGALAVRRSNFKGNLFALASEAARKAAFTPIRPRVFNSRAPYWNTARVEAPPPPVQRRPSASIAKVTVPAHPQVNATTRQRPQTLDSLFANMKKQRSRALPQRQNVAAQQRNGDRQQQIPPWRRYHLGNRRIAQR